MLDLTRGWIVECSRCANEAFSEEDEREEAHHQFRKNGWTRDATGTLCPQCSGPALKAAIDRAKAARS